MVLVNGQDLDAFGDFGILRGFHSRYKRQLL